MAEEKSLFDQQGSLFINGDSADTGEIVKSTISFSGGPQPVSAQFTCLFSYSDKNAYFRLFVNKGQSFTLRYELKDVNGLEGATLRTIEFQEAKITDYVEAYDAEHQSPLSGINDLLVNFSISAKSVKMGESSFPSGS